MTDRRRNLFILLLVAGLLIGSFVAMTKNAPARRPATTSRMKRLRRRSVTLCRSLRGRGEDEQHSAVVV
ncbi:MAG TPA: hypothetical protein VF587_09415, partial [Solirubrobacteraceae bacterium]